MALDRRQARNMLEDLRSGRMCAAEAIRNIKAKAKESAKNSRCISEVGAAPVLGSILSSLSSEVRHVFPRNMEACEEALAALVLLPLDENTRRLISGPRMFLSLAWILSWGSLQSKINAAKLLEVLAMDRDMKLAIGSTVGIFEGLVDLLSEYSSPMAIKASLRSLFFLCVFRRNRVRAVDAGAIGSLVELLVDVADKHNCEDALAVLEIMCRCAEGRLAVAQHGLAIPAIARKIFSVSDIATESAVRILWSLCKHSPDDGVQKKLVDAGVFSKLLLMLQMDFVSNTKHELSDLLKLVSNLRMHCPDVGFDEELPRIEISRHK